MKPTITLLAITVLAAFALVGCNQNTPGSSTDTQSTNSSMSDAGGTTGAVTNMAATNSIPSVNTNMPATVILPDTNTNMPTSTNQ
jgi:predicted small secreted protein